MMRFFLPLFLVLMYHASTVRGHSRWTCPEPRSPSTGIKSGPCGSDTNDFSGTPVEISPGLMRVSFEESIDHTGAPWRISLSREGTDTDEPCILLDHIPHNDLSNPNQVVPSTWVPYYITIDIPDVDCERCSLHLSNPMTDKIGGSGSPTGAGCTDPGSCNSVYHSCSLPLKITGSIPRNDYECPSLPSDWPTVWDGDGGRQVDASVPQLYRRESGTWEDALLMNVPERYRLDAGTLCGSGETLPPPVIACVSGNMPVELLDGTTKAVKQVKIGDMVRVGPDAFERVYGFGHADEVVSAEYILLEISGGQQLEISSQHLVFKQNGDTVPASMLNVGDILDGGDSIDSIKTVLRQGAYAPFTKSGAIMVNKVKISNYISFQKDSSYLKIAGFETCFSFQWLAHSFLTIHRNLGIMNGLDAAHAASRWWLSCHPVLILLILIPVVLILGMLVLLEMFMLRAGIRIIIALAILTLITRRREMMKGGKVL